MIKANFSVWKLSSYQAGDIPDYCVIRFFNWHRQQEAWHGPLLQIVHRQNMPSAYAPQLARLKRGAGDQPTPLLSIVIPWVARLDWVCGALAQGSGCVQDGMVPSTYGIHGDNLQSVEGQDLSDQQPDNLYCVQPPQFVSMDSSVFVTRPQWIALVATASAPGQQAQDTINIVSAMWSMMSSVFQQQLFQSRSLRAPPGTPRMPGTPTALPKFPALVTYGNTPRLTSSHPVLQRLPLPSMPGTSDQSTVIQPLQQMQYTPATPGPSGQSSDPSHQQQQDVTVPTPPSDPVLPSTFTLDSSRQQNIRASDHNQTTESDQQVEEEFVSERDYEVFWQAFQSSRGFFRSLQLTTRIIWI